MNKIIVSLTSYPKRIISVYRVIESLYKQTLPADEIRIQRYANSNRNKYKNASGNCQIFRC